MYIYVNFVNPVKFVVGLCRTFLAKVVVAQVRAASDQDGVSAAGSGQVLVGGLGHQHCTILSSSWAINYLGTSIAGS